MNIIGPSGNRETFIGLAISPATGEVFIVGFDGTRAAMLKKCRDRFASEDELKDADRWRVFRLYPPLPDVPTILDWFRESGLTRKEAIATLKELVAEIGAMVGK